MVSRSQVEKQDIIKNSEEDNEDEEEQGEGKETAIEMVILKKSKLPEEILEEDGGF